MKILSDEQIEAFDEICNLIMDGKEISGNLLGDASGGSAKRFVNMEKWLTTKNYKSFVRNGVLIYKIGD